MMLRNDGVYVIYILQHKYLKGGEWINSGDAGPFLVNVPVEIRYAGQRGRYTGSKFPYNEFTVSGNVWQKLGIHGTEDFSAACGFLDGIAMQNPKHSFRIVKVTLSQHTEEMTIETD